MSDDGFDLYGGKSKGEEDPKVGDGGLGKLDRYLDAVGNQRRRYILYYLRDEGRTTASDIAKRVVAWETNRSPSALSDDEYHSVQTELQHNHLPRLADYGLIEYDPRTGDVKFEDPPQSFRLLLGLCHIIEGPSE